MRYIFILLFLILALSALAQQNIVESLQRNRAGEGTVTIHQDPKITGLIGSTIIQEMLREVSKNVESQRVSGSGLCRKQFAGGS